MKAVDTIRNLMWGAFWLAASVMTGSVMAESVMVEHNEIATELLLDDRQSADLVATSGARWRLISDDVMGGVSAGSLTPEHYQGRDCLMLRGRVSTQNNGGFLQMSLPLAGAESFDASAFNAVQFTLAGNNTDYNLHLRTKDLWLPWQSYRATVAVTGEWQTFVVPFSQLESYRSFKRFNPARLERLALVAIGRDFNAELCLADLRLLRLPDTSAPQ